MFYSVAGPSWVRVSPNSTHQLSYLGILPSSARPSPLTQDAVSPGSRVGSRPLAECPKRAHRASPFFSNGFAMIEKKLIRLHGFYRFFGFDISFRDRVRRKMGECGTCFYHFDISFDADRTFGVSEALALSPSLQMAGWCVSAFPNPIHSLPCIP